MSTRVAKHKKRETRLQKRAMKERKSTLFFCIFVIVFAICIRLFVINTIRVDGPSMEPTLYTGEYVMINKLSTLFGLPDRYKIIVCKFVGQNKNFIKRVVALPGETVEVKDGDVYINNALLNDDIYGDGLRPQDMATITVPDECVFVMGDNRDNSADSCVYGPVPRALIEGVAFCVIWPFDSLQFL